MKSCVLVATLAAALVLPATALAYTSAGTAVTVIPVGTAASSETNPHVDGDLVVYTELVTNSDIGVRSLDLATGTAGSVPRPADAVDVYADVFGGTIVFTRSSAPGGDQIFTYAAGAAAPTEVAPTGGNSNRSQPAIAGGTIAFEDRLSGSSPLPTREIFVVDAAGAVRLTNNTLQDLSPAVSPAGDLVVWRTCPAPPGACEVTGSRRLAGTWSSPFLIATGAASGYSIVSTDGASVVYVGEVAGVRRLYTVSLASPGQPALVPLPPGQVAALEPAISGGHIAFTGVDSAGDTDIFVSGPNGTLTPITDTPAFSETLPDSSFDSSSGKLTVVWQINENGDDNVYATRLSTDVRPPRLGLPRAITVNATSPAGASVTYSASATDDLDPAPSIVCVPPSGAIFPIAVTNVSCTATDAAGNSAMGSFDVRVKGADEQIVDLIAKTASYLRLPTLSASLRAALLSASSTLLSGNKPLACAALSFYIDVVAGQAGRTLTGAQAADLITDSRRIRAVIGC